MSWGCVISGTVSAEPAAPAPRGRLRAAAAARFGGLPGAFWIMFSGMIANRVGNMVVPFLVFFLGTRHVSAGAAGLVAAAVGFGGLFGPALGGLLADRVGRRFTVILGLTLTPFGLGALFAAPSVPLFIAAAVVLGAGSSVPKPAASALVSDIVAPAQQMKAFSLLHWAINIGTAISSAAAGFLAAHGYWLLFLVDGVGCLAFAVIVYLGVPAGTHPTAGAAERTTGYGVVLRDRVMLGYLAINLLGVLIYSQTEFAVPLAIKVDGLSPTVFGLVGATNAILVIVLQPFAYQWMVGLDRVRILVAAWLLIGLGVAGTGLADHAWQYAATTVVWTVGEVAHAMVGATIVADLAPPDARGRYQGAFAWIWSVARFAAPAIASLLFVTAGEAALWWGCVGVAVLTTAATLRLAGPMRRRAAALAAATRDA
ncbi:MFS transporter [Dactylosporangium sp. AC04546]|uniref:MFS transporter n=1 Tax=Dactylosporangium sp. AC04546 TaxID=2862460 RepID=UPI001EDCFB91|nr:MFS transporter [Dactylosporangium sp. AC04546]WVK79086.1 MFS transporter [Dactylosporangium sp. AC04546]